MGGGGKVTIGVNGLSLVHRGSGGVSCATLPDVCVTKEGAPVPFGNTALSRDLEDGTLSVRFDGGSSAAIATSRLARSYGGEPGVRGGVVSGVTCAEATFLTHSFDVRFEGQGACRLTDKMLHNRGNTVNCAGIVQEPVAGRPQVDDGEELGTRDAALWVNVVGAIDQQPVPHARVTIEREGERPRRKWTTKKGIARFKAPAGPYEVHVQHDRYEPASARGRAARPHGDVTIPLAAAVVEPWLPAHGIHKAALFDAWQDAELSAIAGANLQYVRLNFVSNPARTEEEQQDDIETYVKWAQWTAAKGLRALPMVLTTDASNSVRWSEFLQALCNRLKPGGGIFPVGSPYAVRCWEIWNEPNLTQYWQPGPNPEAFRATLAVARDALRLADGRARIIFGGLSESGANYDPLRFLKNVVEGQGPLFDAVAFHPYGRTAKAAMAKVELLYKKLVKLDLSGKDPKTDVHIWLTEIGWAVPNAPWPGGSLPYFTAADPSEQAAFIGEFAKLVEKNRREWRLGPTIWFNYNDYEGAEDPKDPVKFASAFHWAGNCGLFEAHERDVHQTADAQGNPAFHPNGAPVLDLTLDSNGQPVIKNKFAREAALAVLRARATKKADPPADTRVPRLVRLPPIR